MDAARVDQLLAVWENTNAPLATCRTALEEIDDDALYFRNGTDASYQPVLGTTFEKGAAVVDATSVGVLFVGDED